MKRKRQLGTAGQNVKKTAILVVTIGNSGRESSKNAASAIEAAITRQFPDCRIYRAFVNRRLDPGMNRVKEALKQAVSDEVYKLIVQPAYLMPGLEYKNLAQLLIQYERKFDRLVIGEPLLTGDDDFETVKEALIQMAAEYDDSKTAVCFVGHGGADADPIYAKMQQMLTKAGHKNYYIGTIRAEPSLEDVKQALQADGNYERVVLQPFMTTAGSHAYLDMAGDREGSWKHVLEQAGYEVICRMEGLGQIPAVQKVFAAHVKAAEGQLEDGRAGTDSCCTGGFCGACESGRGLINRK